MGEVKERPPVKLFIGMISQNEDLCHKAEEFLIPHFGPIDYNSVIIPFVFTDYYEEEMGKNLLRKFVSFKNLIEPGQLPDIKLLTNQLELQISQPNRSINLDPGYLNGSKMILATTKDYSHRIYLQKGIYAEVTLRFQKGTFFPFDYTYRDYATPEYIKIFNDIRQIYLTQV